MTVATESANSTGRYTVHLIQRGNIRSACFYADDELNPSRADMVAHPADYRWSSYRCNVQAEINPLISPRLVYLPLDKDEMGCLTACRDLVRYHFETELVDEIRRAANGGFVLGNERFQKQIAAMIGRRT